MGVGAEVATKAPINTLIAAWQEQPVPVKRHAVTLAIWRGWESAFPQADALYTADSEQECNMPWDQR